MGPGGDTGRALKLARTRVEAEEREVSGIEQSLKEARRRLTLSHERTILATVEERDALARKGNACQGLRRQKDRLREARRRRGSWIRQKETLYRASWRGKGRSSLAHT